MVGILFLQETFDKSTNTVIFQSLYFNLVHFTNCTDNYGINSLPIFDMIRINGNWKYEIWVLVARFQN